tara:strand:- start:1942 stop:2184 length:243 start_codon:yes stop_codon:yes gene_type:complete
MELYKPIKSTRKNKKYMVLTKKGIIHFGDSRYEDFRQHKDKKRQENYCKRAKGITNKKGEKTYNDKDTANYWSYKFLWDC